MGRVISIKKHKRTCWIEGLTQEERHAEIRKGFFFTLHEVQESLIDHEPVSEQLWDNFCVLAHLSGLIDCKGNWIGDLPKTS
jgi:hypothetical protein